MIDTNYNIPATVMTMPSNVSFNGLLGLSFVKTRRITIDASNQRMVIESPQPTVASAVVE